MVDVAFYLATEEIARRSGVMQSRYRVPDGRILLDNKDLSNIRLTTEEYLHGLSGIEQIDKNDAMALVRKNGYVMGLPTNAPQVNNAEDAVLEEQNDEPNEESDTETEVATETNNNNEEE